MEATSFPRVWETGISNSKTIPFIQDIKFIVGPTKKEFRCHKLLLSFSSPFWSKIFQFQQNTKNNVKKNKNINKKGKEKRKENENGNGNGKGKGNENGNGNGNGNGKGNGNGNVNGKVNEKGKGREKVVDGLIRICEKTNFIQEIVLEEISDKSFQHYLDFLYKRSVCLTSETVVDLLFLAKNFQTQKLEGCCTKYISVTMCCTNIFFYLERSIVLNLREISLVMRDFVKKNIGKILNKCGCLDLPSEWFLVGLIKQGFTSNCDQIALYRRLVERGKFLTGELQQPIIPLNVHNKVDGIVKLITWKPFHMDHLKEISSWFGFDPRAYQIKKKNKQFFVVEAIPQIDFVKRKYKTSIKKRRMRVKEKFEKQKEKRSRSQQGPIPEKNSNLYEEDDNYHDEVYEDDDDDDDDDDDYGDNDSFNSNSDFGDYNEEDDNDNGEDDEFRMETEEDDYGYAKPKFKEKSKEQLKQPKSLTIIKKLPYKIIQKKNSQKGKNRKAVIRNSERSNSNSESRIIVIKKNHKKNENGSKKKSKTETRSFPLKTRLPQKENLMSYKVALFTTEKKIINIEDIVFSIKSQGIKNVQYVNLVETSPNKETIKEFDAIFLYSIYNYPIPKITELSDLLVDYIKDGGGVVICTCFTMVNDHHRKKIKENLSPLRGNIIKRGFLPLTLGMHLTSTKNSEKAILGSVLYPDSPLVKHVKSFHGGNQSHRINTKFSPCTELEIEEGGKSQLIAKYTDGIPFIAWKQLQKNYGIVVCLNLFPLSGHIRHHGNGRFWQLSSNGRAVMSNAVEFALKKM
ncbi:lute [Anaeramoeba flamelloides]|uniref:Lute n=1 Tax=Anaeramoeba flamelloides TaxID=1746091 RepID=A0ABQ8YAD2_9EUKA|nr:lute [Anaeramoeba flamelloides]